MTPVYSVRITDSDDFTDIPKAKISCYRWETGYEPEAFAQLIYLRGLGFCLRM